MEREYLTAKDVAEKVGCSTDTVYRATLAGELEGYDVGGYRYKPEAVAAWIEARKVRPRANRKPTFAKPRRVAKLQIMK